MKRCRCLLSAFLVFTLVLALVPLTGTVAYADEPITVTVFVSDPGNQPAANNKIYRLIEETFGVHFEFEFLSGNLDETLALKINNQDYEDLFSGGYGSEFVISNGALINLLDYISEEQTPNLWSHIEDQRDRLIGENDSLYIIPNYGLYDGSEIINSVGGPAFFIQKQVLAWANYPTVRTLDDYFDVIEQFMQANPTDANGDPYIGFAILCEDWRHFCLINPVQHLMGRPNDGEVLIDVSSDEYHTETFIDKPYAKAYYQKLNDEYSKGIIQHATFTDSYDDYIDKISSGLVLGMFDQAWDLGMGTSALLSAGMYENAYVALGLVYSEENLAGVALPTENWTIEEHYLNGSVPNVNRGFGVSVNCEHPERVIAMWEALMSDRWQLILNWGIEGEDYYIDENGRLNMTAEQYANLQNAEWRLSNKADALFQNSPKKQGYIQNDIQVGDKTVRAGNCWEPDKQDEIVFGLMNDYDKAFLAAYGYSKWSDFMNEPIELAPYGEAWQISYGPVDLEHSEFLAIQDEWLPRLIMADPAEFDAMWEDFVEAISPYAEVFQAYMQEQVLLEVEKGPADPSVADSGTLEGLTWTLNNTGTLTISGSGAIPEIEEEEAWLQYTQRIETVVIEDGVTGISGSAFTGCFNLNSITVPASVTQIDSGAFSDCFQLLLRVEPDSYLMEYAIENHVPYWIIGDQKSGAWGTLNWVLDDDGILTISGNGMMDPIGMGDAWLNNRLQIKRVIIAEGVTSIASGAFGNCYNLASVELPDGLTQIGESAFSVCLHLNSINLPDSITSIGMMTFFNCSRLASVTLPRGITAIEEGTFNSSGLRRIVIPEGVTEIIGDAFAYCGKLKEIVLPDSMTSIGRTSFMFCTSLTSAFIPASVTSIRNAAFLNCPALTLKVAPDSYALEYAVENEIPYQIRTTGTCGEHLAWTLSGGTLTISGTGDMDDFDYMNPAPWGDYSNQIQSVVIEDGVTGIGAGAFNGFGSLTSVTVPSTVASIRSSAFMWCESLQEINLPEGVTTLGDTLFYRSGLTGIHLPASLTTLEGQSLAGSLSMAAITVAEGNTRFASEGGVLFTKDMGTLLTFPAGKSGDYEVPSGVHTIHEFAFEDATKLGVLTIPGTVQTIERFGLYQCVADEIILENGIRTIGVSAFNGCHPGNDELVIPSSVEEIGDYAFYMSYLENVEVSPDNPYFSSMDGSLYNKDHSRLIYPRYGTDSFDIPAGVTSIAPGAFAYNGKITSVSIPGGVTQISEDMFFACSSLRDVTIPASVTGIGNRAFLGCSSLSSITIPDGVTSIGDSAFSECENLNFQIIPAGVTSIGSYAFNGCNRLFLLVYADSAAMDYAIANHLTYVVLSEPTFTLPAELTTIEDEAFSGISASAVYIPENVTYIDGDPFDGSQVCFIWGVPGTEAQFFANRYGYIFIPVSE